MKANFKKLATLALSIVMLMSFGVLGFAAENNWKVSKSKSVDPYKDALTPDKRTTTVTLSLPAAEEQLASDVVFVVDKSTGADLRVAAQKTIDELYAAAQKTGAKIKVGVVVFNYAGHNASNGLQELTDESVVSALKEAVAYTPSNGTNIHGGLVIAQQMLAGDTSVDNSRKYVVLLTDGITYIFNDDENKPASIGTTIFSSGEMLDTEKEYRHPFPYQINYDSATAELKYGSVGFSFKADPSQDSFTAVSDYLARIESQIKPELFTEYVGKYNVTKASFETISDFEAAFDNTIIHFVQPGNTEYVENTKAYLDSMGFNYEFESDTANNIDVAVYKAAKLWEELCKDYNCFALRRANTYPWGTELVDYMQGVAGHDEIDFETIKNDIFYLLDAGSTVVDTIGSSDVHDFDLVPDSFKMKVGTETLTATSLGDNMYGFGEMVDNKYAYEVKYLPATEQSEERFVWYINVPVSQLVRVQLSYDLELVVGEMAPGAHTDYVTNNSAILRPIDTDHQRGEEEEFEVPVVTFTAPATEVAIEKVWDDADNQDGIRPEEITINLLNPDGSLNNTISISGIEAGFKNLQRYATLAAYKEGSPIVYSVEEVLEEDSKYESKVELDKETGKFIITNTYTPATTSVTVTKVWDDENNVDKLRPETLALTLYANGNEVVGVAPTVSKNGDKWTYTWENLPAKANGQDIAYTVKENVVPEEYKSEATEAVSGGTITNSHTPKPTPSAPPAPQPQQPQQPSNGGTAIIPDENVPLGSSPFKTSNTGDEFNGIGYSVALVASIACITWIVSKKKKGEF